MTCVACEDKTVNMFGKGGKRLLPPLMLGSAVSVVRCTGHHVMAVTAHGYLHVWSVFCLVDSETSCNSICGFFFFFFFWWEWWKLDFFVVL